MSDLNEPSRVVGKKKKWIIPVIIGGGLLLLAGVAALVVVIVSSGAPKHALKKQLGLGEKYLTDLDYENAILAYEGAILIDPKNTDAYLGLGEAYLKLAEEKQSEDDYDAAMTLLDTGISKLQEGLDNTGDEEIKKKLDEIEDKKAENEEKRKRKLEEIAEGEEKKKAEEEKKKAEEERKQEYQTYDQVESGVLADIAKALSENHTKSAFDYMFSDAYSDLISDMKNSQVESQIVNTPYGPIGVYHIESGSYAEVGNYYIYCGDFKDRMKDGFGKWLEADIVPPQEWQTSPHQSRSYYECNFAEDMPNGEAVKYSFDNEEDDEMHIDRRGNVVNGLWDGRVMIMNGTWSATEDGSVGTFEGGELENWYMFSNGYFTNYDIIESTQEEQVWDDYLQTYVMEDVDGFLLQDKDDPNVNDFYKNRDALEKYLNTPKGILGYYYFDDSVWR